jgi:hypothetical protein
LFEYLVGTRQSRVSTEDGSCVSPRATPPHMWGGSVPGSMQDRRAPCARTHEPSLDCLSCFANNTAVDFFAQTHARHTLHNLVSRGRSRDRPTFSGMGSRPPKEAGPPRGSLSRAVRTSISPARRLVKHIFTSTFPNANAHTHPCTIHTHS